MPINLKQLTEKVLKNTILLTVDTRAYRIYIFQGDKYIINKKPDDIPENTGCSIIDETEIIPFIQRLQELTYEHAVFYFLGSIATPSFWPLKYIKFFRVSESQFSVRTESLYEIDWKKCTKENLILDVGWKEN